MGTKKEASIGAKTLVAAAAIAIEGTHFDAGAPIEGVSDDELRKAVSARRVVTYAEYVGDPEPVDDDAAGGDEAAAEAEG